MDSKNKTAVMLMLEWLYFGFTLATAVITGQWWICVLAVTGAVVIEQAGRNAHKVKRSVTSSHGESTDGGSGSGQNGAVFDSPDYCRGSTAEPDLVADQGPIEEEDPSPPTPPSDSSFPLTSLYSPKPSKYPLADDFASHITSTTIIAFPSSVLAHRFDSSSDAENFEAQLSRSIELQHSHLGQPSPFNIRSSPQVHSVPSDSMDQQYTTVAEMESIQHELAAALGFRAPPSPFRDSIGSFGSSSSLASMLDRPRAPFFAPPTPAADMEDLVSMELLGTDVCPTITRPATPGSIRAPSIAGSPAKLSRTLTNASISTRSFHDDLAAFAMRRTQSFPTIDDVISIHESVMGDSTSTAPASPPQHPTRMNSDDTEITSGDESQADLFSDEEDTNSVDGASPATSVDGDDVANEAKPDVIIPTLRNRAGPKTPKRKQTPPKKNNGHKRVPMNRRLSSSSKQKFLSRAVW